MRLVVAGLVNCCIMSDICLCSCFWSGRARGFMSSMRDVGGVYVLVLGRDEVVAEAVERGMVCINLDEDV